MSENNTTTTSSEPTMVAAEILDYVEDILKASPVAPLSSGYLGSQFFKKTNTTFRTATGGKGILSFLRDYDDFIVRKNTIILKGDEPRDNRDPEKIAAKRQQRQQKQQQQQRSEKPKRQIQRQSGPMRNRKGRGRKPVPKKLYEGETPAVAQTTNVSVPVSTNTSAAPNAKRFNKKNRQQQQRRFRNNNNVLKAFLVDFDDGCQNFAKDVKKVPKSHSVHLYLPQRLPGSSAPEPPESARGFHPHVTETDSSSAVQTAIAVRATQLAIQKRNKVHIYIVSGHVGKYAELIPQIKRLGVQFISEVDGTKFALKDLVALNLNEETLLIAQELSQHIKIMGKNEMGLRDLASFVMSVVGKKDADEDGSPETELKAELIDRVSMNIKQLARRQIVSLVTGESEESISLEDVTAVREYLSSGRTSTATVKVSDEKITAAINAAEERKREAAAKEQEKEQPVESEE